MPDSLQQRLETCQQELTAWETRFRNIIQKNADGVIVIDQEGIVRFVNPAAEALLGRKADKLVGQMLGFPLASPPPSSGSVPEGTTQRTELDIIRPDGETAIAEMHVVETTWDGAPAYLASLRDITQRVQAEAEVRFQAQLLDMVEQAVIATDCEGHIIYWNRFAETLYGWPATQVRGRNLVALIEAPDTQVQARDVMTFIQEGQSWSGERLLQRRDGSTFPALTTTAPIYDDQGQIVGMVGVSMDITEQKRAQQALRESEERYRQVNESVQDIIYAVDREGKLTFISGAFKRLLGQPREALIGKRLDELAAIVQVEPQSLQEVFARYKQARAEKRESMQYDLTLEIHGQRRHLSSKERMLYDAEGHLLGSSGILRDITERVQIEQALQESEAKFRTLAETTRAAIVIFQEGQLRYANPSAEAITGYTVDQLPQTDVLHKLLAHDLTGTPDAKEPPKTTEQFETCIRTAEGSQCCLDVSVGIIELEGQPAILSTFFDITERVRTEAALAWEAGVNAAIAELSSALISSASLAEIALLILERAKRLTGSVYGYVGHIDPQTGYLICPTMTKDIWESCRVPDKDIIFKEFGGLWGWVLEHREPLLTNDLTQEPRSTGTPPGHIPIQRFLSVPALIQDRLVGQIALANAPRDYTEQDLILVKRMASLYALAIQRQRAKTALQESEQKFRSVVEQSSDGIVLIDEQGTIIEWNRGQEEISGLSTEDVIGRPLWEVQFQIAPPEQQTPAAREQLEHIVNELLQNPKAPWFHQIVENQVQRPDGTRRTTQSLIFPLETGHRFMVGSVTRDVTESKAAEQALQKSERRFRAVSELTSDYAYALRVDPDATLVCEWVTEAFSRITGFTLAEIKASGGWEQLVHPADREAAQKRKTRLLANQADVRELRIVAQDGQVRWIRDHRKPVWDQQQDRVVRIYGAAQDITARKQAEATLEGLRQQHELILKAAGEGIYGLDAQGHTTFLNPAGERLLGYTAEEIRRMPHHDLIHHSRPDGTPYPHAECPIYATLQDGVSRHIDDEVFWRKDGSHFAVDYTSTPIVKDGEIVGAVVTFQDITERVQAEAALAQQAQELARSNAELQQFAYAASHDLQEPLRMVTSYLGLIERRYKGKLDADADDFINYAVDGVQRMNALINDLLAFSRVNTRGKAFAPTDSEMALNRALSNLKIAIEESRAVVTHDPLPMVMTDEPQLVQVFQNLISNAIKFQDQDNTPQVHVSAQRKNGEWTFVVQDNGIGIDPQHHERIFEIFQRLHTRDEYSGTGIGLAICKKIIERHGGQIWFESKLGQGTTFYFTVPASQEK